MLFHQATAKFINFRDQSVEELAVVAHHDNRAVKIADGILQHVFRTHIKMVRRFVENQEVHRFQQQLDHRQTATLPAGKHLDFLVGCLAAKHESAQDVADFQPHIALGHTVYRVEHRQLAVQQLRLVLRKIADLHVVPYLQMPVKRDFAHDALDERGFPFAVLAHESHFLASFQGEIHIVEHHMAAVCLPYALTNKRIIAAPRCRRKFQPQRGRIHLVHLHRHDFLQLLDAALHLHGLGGFVTETLDKVLDVSNFFLLVLVGPELLFPTLGP